MFNDSLCDRVKTRNTLNTSSEGATALLLYYMNDATFCSHMLAGPQPKRGLAPRMARPAPDPLTTCTRQGANQYFRPEIVKEQIR